VQQLVIEYKIYAIVIMILAVFHGFTDNIRPCIAKAVYVVPIKVEGGTHLKILDAFACGKAVVSTSVGCGGLDLTLGENVLIGDSPSEFANQVANLLKDETLRMKLGANARKLVMEKYSWEKISLLQGSIYRGMVNEQSI
jgi:glycosyltransferase involved in cell wall biosynthesis